MNPTIPVSMNPTIPVSMIGSSRHHRKADILRGDESVSAFWPRTENKQAVEFLPLESGAGLDVYQISPGYWKTPILELTPEIREYEYFFSPSPSFLTPEPKVRVNIDLKPFGSFVYLSSRRINSLSIVISELLKKSEVTEKIRSFYASRIEMLRNEATIDNIPFNKASESDFWTFIKSTLCIQKGSLFLRDNGNLRAVWSDDKDNHIGIQFFGDSSAQYVIFKRHADGEVWRYAQCDSLNNIEHLIEKLDLKFLLHA